MRSKKYYNATTELLTDPETEFYKATDEPPAELEANDPETKNGIIANSLFVNARKEPSLEAEVLEGMRSGDVVEILERVGGFCKVLTGENGITYISSDFIKEE